MDEEALIEVSVGCFYSQHKIYWTLGLLQMDWFISALNPNVSNFVHYHLILSPSVQVIDEILQADDKNNDGLLDYIEFSQAERHFIWCVLRFQPQICCRISVQL